ncbi:MAG: hypothetical protein OEW67_14360 [Cyclobacteriaceae bacterium]|nr:hypothetical protein [Cyclobacteriaceae bacterium]
MKKKIITPLLALLITAFCYGQDSLVYKNGDEVKVKVIEITSLEVKFKRYDNIDGPLYTISKSELFMIKYENGIKDLFSEQIETKKPPSNNIQNIDIEEELGYDRIKYNGPRLGFTVLGNGSSKDRLAENNYSPFITQFGWQFEARIFSSPEGISGLVEWVLLVGGIEKGLFLPSASMLFGIRGKNGAEFGIGPNLSLAGVGMVFAAGGSIQSGKMVFPINLSVVPSVNNSLEGGQSTGVRVSLTFGFNTRRH